MRSRLTFQRLLDTVLCMKKKVTAREFLHGFAKMHKALEPGQSITITKHGKPVGQFVKQRVKGSALPNFREAACADGYGPEVGDALLTRILADEALS